MLIHSKPRPLSGYEWLVLTLYGWLMRAARPLLRRKLARRAQTEPGYAHAVQARFGRYDAPAAQSTGMVLWVHAVSLGETRAAAVLVQRLRNRLPGVCLLLTHSTATGWTEGQRLLQPGDRQTWLPWDDPWSVRRFLVHHRPAVGVLMETEIWPTLMRQADQAGIPMVLANARLNERSTRGAHQLAWLSRPAYAALTVTGAQTAADAERLRQVGALDPVVWGNLKFDARPDATQQHKAHSWRQRLGRPVVLLASSRDGEESDFYKEICGLSVGNKKNIAINKFVFLIVPRHPQRFDAVVQALEKEGAKVARRAEWGAMLEAHGAAVAEPVADLAGLTLWLGDSLGEMALYASLADVALLGGSFQPLGGQNLIELAACGCTVVVGPHTFNFADATEQALQAGVAHRVPDMCSGVKLACDLLSQAENPHAGMTSARQLASAWAQSHQGAAERAADAVVTCLEEGGHPPGSQSQPVSVPPGC